MRHGRRPIPACSITRPSTTGTPARHRVRSGHRTRARSTCSSMTRRAISPRSASSPSPRLRGEGRDEGLFSTAQTRGEAPTLPSPASGGGKEAFDIEGYEHAVRLWTIVLEISVLMAQFPSREIAQLSYEFRTLGLGYANVGCLLMSSGIPYDSEAGRAICAALTAIMTGVSYATSAEMAAELGPFPGYKKNREAMLRVIRNHRRAAHGEKTGYEKIATPPVRLDHAACLAA